MTMQRPHVVRTVTKFLEIGASELLRTLHIAQISPHATCVYSQKLKEPYVSACGEVWVESACD